MVVIETFISHIIVPERTPKKGDDQLAVSSRCRNSDTFSALDLELADKTVRWPIWVQFSSRAYGTLRSCSLFQALDELNSRGSGESSGGRRNGQ